MMADGGCQTRSRTTHHKVTYIALATHLPSVTRAVHDATGASAVLEFSETPDTVNPWSFVINPIGVLTNSPNLATQISYYNEWAQNQVG